MTVNTTATRNGPYTPNGVTTVFPFTFRAINSADLQVVRIGVDGSKTILSSALYNTTILSNGGSVAFAAPPATGDPLYVEMTPSFLQQISFENEGAFLPEVVSEALDRAAMRSLFLLGQIVQITTDITAFAGPIAAAAAAAVVIDIQAQVDAQALRGVYYDLPTALAGGTVGQFVGVAQPSLYAIDTYAKTSANDLVLSTGLTRAIGDGIAVKQKITADMAIAWPVTPIYDLNPVDAKFINSSSIPNRASPTPTQDRVVWDATAISTPYSAVITPNYAADPFGGNTATRVQIPNTSNPASIAGGFNFSGASRLRFQAKSKAGAGNQTLYVSTGFSGGTAFALTEGAWTQVEFKTSAAASLYLITSGPALDIVMTRPQVAPREVLPPQPSVPRIGEAVKATAASDGDWPVDARGNLITPIPGRLKPTATGALRNFSAMTFVVTLKQTAAGASQYNGVWFSQAAGFTDLNIGARGSEINCAGPGLNYTNQYANNLLLGDEFVTLAFRFDATRSSFTLGSIELGTGTGTGGTSYPVNLVYLGGSGFSDNSPFNGLLHKFTVFDSYLSDLALSAAVQKHQQSAASFNNAVGAKNFGIFLGDSITAYIGANSPATCYAATTQNNLQPMKGLNLGVPGTGLAYQVSILPQILAAIAAGKRDGKNMIVSCMIGVNGIPLISDYQTQLVNPIRAAGAKFVLYTVTSSNAIADATKNAYNAALRTMTVDAIADIAADARLGGNGAYANATWFPDGLHPSQAGHDLIATLGTPAWRSVQV